MREKIIEYLKEKYNPISILLYGSYSNGMNDASSDFDCMVIVENGNTDTFITAYDAEIVLDDGTGERLRQRVRDYVRDNSVTEESEKRFVASWIVKTCKRIEKGDDEGNYRAFMLMSESLADYYMFRDMFYFGSKKAIKYLKENDVQGYEIFHKAVVDKNNEAIVEWLRYLCNY